MKRAIFTIFLSLAISAPAVAGARDRNGDRSVRYDRYDRHDYPSDYQRHKRRDNTPTLVAAILGGVDIFEPEPLHYFMKLGSVMTDNYVWRSTHSK